MHGFGRGPGERRSRLLGFRPARGVRTEALTETLSGDPTLELPEFDAPPDDPLPLLERWLRLADERGVREPRALALATADAEGRPSSRILLLKQATPALV